MTEDRPELWKIINLRQVSLRRALSETSLIPEALPEVPPQLMIDIRSSGADRPDISCVEFLAGIRIASEPVAGEAVSFLIEAEYRLLYDRPGDYIPEQAEIDEFAQRSVIFCVWPYWREFTQSLYARMDMPFPPLPVYRHDSGVHQVVGSLIATDDQKS